MKLNFIKTDIAVCIGLVLVFLVFYGSMLTGVPSGYADADGLLLAAHQGTLAHPPGYPWLSLLLNPILRLTDGYANPFLVTGWVVSLFQAINVGLLAYLGMKWLGRLSKNRLVISLAAVIGAAWWGVSVPVIQHALLLEIFPFATLGLLLFLITAGNIYERIDKKEIESWYWYTLVGLAGLLPHLHQLTIPLVMLVFVVLANKLNGIKRISEVYRSFAGTVGVWLAGFGLYWSFLEKSGEYGWGMIPTIRGAWDFYWRLVYDQGGSAVETYAARFDPTHSWTSIGLWLEYTQNSFHITGLLLMVFGLVWLMRRYQRTGFLFIGLLMVYGFGMVAYMKFPLVLKSFDVEYFWGTALRLRMLFVTDLLLALLIMIGAYALLMRFWGKYIYVTGATLVIILGLVSYLHRDYVIAHHTTDIAEYTKEVLVNLPEEAVLVVDSDLVFTFLAQQIVNEVRRDVVIIPSALAMRSSWWNEQRGELYLFDFPDINEQLAHIVAFSLQNDRRVFLYASNANLLAFLGLEGEPFFVRPSGYTLEVALEPTEFEASDYQFSSELVERTFADWWLQGFESHVAEQHITLAYYQARWGNLDQAQAHQRQALQMLKLESTERLTRQVIPEAVEANSDRGLISEMPIRDKEYWFEQADEAAGVEQGYYLTRAWLVDQTNPEVYLRIAEYHRDIGEVGRAELDMMHARMLEGGN